ncbi:hypothetical protein ACTFIR_004403 [Dictyostelium discoideum]
MNKILILFICVLSCFINSSQSLTLPQLTAQINGKVISQSSPDFNNARFGYNYRYNRVPQIIVQPLDTASVVLALEYAQTNNLLVSVKSGGHSAIAEGVQDLRVVIDVSQMKQISYDPVSNIITTQSGNKWVEVYNYTINQHQVATPGGSCPSVSVGGLTLGGGANDLSTVHGLATDNVVELEVVLANRSVVIANEQTNVDLFWALRGGGHGGFGIVTLFKFRAHPVLPTYYSAWITYAWADFEDVLTYVNKFSETMPNTVNLYFTAWRSSNATNPSVALSCFFNGPSHLGESHCGSFRNFSGTKKNTYITPVSYSVSNISYYDTVKTGTDPKARSSYTSGSFLTSIDKKVVKNIKTQLEKSPVTPYTFNTARLNLYWQGGQMLNQARDYNAYVHRTYPWNAVWLVSYAGGQFEETYRKWIKQTYRKFESFSEGVYQNYPDENNLDNWAEAYYMENYPKLQVVKAAYDPNNYFKFAQSIGSPSFSS